MNGFKQDLVKQSSSKSENSLACLECRKECTNKRSLGCHIRASHGTKKYYDKHLKKEGDGICDVCGAKTNFINIDRGYKRFCSENCHRSGMSGENNPFYGRTHSEDVLGKIRKAKRPKGEEHHFYGKTGEKHPAYGRKHTEGELEKMSSALKGKAPFTFTDDIREKISQAHKGKTLTEEHKRKISESNIGKHHMSEELRQRISDKVAQAYLDGRLNQSNYKRGYFWSDKWDKKFYYRSSYEEIAYMIFEDDDNVVDIHYEQLKIQVKIDGKVRSCVPDFVVYYKDGRKEIIEVKPLKVSKLPKIRERLEACREYFEKKGEVYHVWTEKELGING